MKYRFFLFAGLLTLLLGACTLSLASDITPPPDYKSPTPGPTMSPLFPQIPPDLSSGAAIFAEKCAPCHGSAGLGDGPMAAQLQKPPAALGKPDVGRNAVPANWYTIVTEGNINSFMPPFKDGLSDQQRWDVVAYSISLAGSTAVEAGSGKAVYEAKCTQCHGPAGNSLPNSNFTDQALMAKLNQNDIAGFINRGVGSMPGFGGLMTDADIYAAAAYVRTFTVGAAAVVPTSAPTATPIPPTATVEASATSAGGSPTATSTGATVAAGSTAVATGATTATQGTPAASNTPAPSNTPAVTSTASMTSTPTAQVGNITGKVVNGSGGSIASVDKATLHVFEHNTTTQQFSEVATQQAPVADGAFSFKNVQMPANRAFYVTVNYSGTDYQSDPAFPKAGQEVFDLPITVYDTTTDTSGLLADQAHLVLDYSKPAVVQVIEYFVITNPGKQTIIPTSKGGPVVKISLPAGYSNLQFEQGGIGDRYIKTADGFADTTSISPSMKQYQIVFAFDLPLPKPGLFGGQNFQFTQLIPVKSSALSVLVPDGVIVEGANITAGGTQDMGSGVMYKVFNAGAFEPGGKFDVSASGLPKGASQAANSISSTQSLVIGIVGLGFVLIGAGAWLFWRERRDSTGDDEDNDEDEEDDDHNDHDHLPGDGSSQDELMDAIVALDDQYKAGNISEEAYKQRRSELKEQLKKLL